MSAHTLTIQYQAAEIDRLTDPYWIRLEPVGQEPETATVSDAANLLDALYQIDPCTESEDQGDLVEQEDYAPTVAATIDLSYCDQAYDGSVEMDIRIIRSHRAEPYRLQLQGGELIQTLQVSEQVTRTLEISGPTTLDYPVVSGFACSPEPLKRVGNTLLFDPALDGQTLRATYRTHYDLATIKVLGVEGQPGECRTLAFHHGLVADETLTPPEAEQVDRSLCPSTSYESPESEDEVTCYQEVVVHRVCSCSLHEVETLRYEEIVPCPGEMHCANNETRCMHLVGTASATTYVSCGDQDRSGDFDGNLSDPEFYFDKCCEWPTGPLPTCVTRHRTYRGGKALIHGPEHYRGLYGALTRIVPVSPPGGICGDWTIEQRLMGNNCCDGVEPLAPDVSINPEVVAPSTTVTVGVLGGGKYPYQWLVLGEGFWFNGPSKRITTGGPTVHLVADSDACGTATISVTDGCSTTQFEIRCTQGRWILKGSVNAREYYLDAIPELYACVTNSYYTETTIRSTQVQGGRMMSEMGANPDPASPATMPKVSGNLCSPIPIIPNRTVLDPVFATFSWIAVISTEWVGGGFDAYRVYFTQPENSSLYFYEWGC
ncbi:MAG: hypothetical protein RBS40_13475 [Rhodocyclaceae bacterium]|jgi:hypothetical protein|nr:hypothetical protein [Rhodocyclaceae bacterium]